MTKGRATAALALVAAIMIAIALMLVGGPGQARKERRDQQRMDDLSALATLVDCLATTNRGLLPERLAITPQCDRQARLEDPFTGQPYRYEPTGPSSYRLCARFETSVRQRGTRGRWARDDDGCISRLHVPPAQSGAAATIPYRE